MISFNFKGQFLLQCSGGQKKFFLMYVFFIRNFADQKAVAHYMKIAESKKVSNQEDPSHKAVVQK